MGAGRQAATRTRDMKWIGCMRGKWVALTLGSLGAIGLGACGGGASADSSDSVPGLSAAAQLGQKIFVDKTLSVSGQQSCATCHVAAYAFAGDPSNGGPDHGSPVPLGGPNMDLPGFRNSPSLMYA